MANPAWWQAWHGTPFPASTATGGSTAMSTGVVQALSTKASDVHGHTIADCAGLASTLAGLAAQISTKAAGVHTHATADVSSLASTLSGLAAAISTKAAGVHTHATDDVSSLASTLSGLAAAISTKAAGVHTHAQADITDLVSTLAAVSAAISTKAAGAHTHAQADVTSLVSTLAALSAAISTKAAGTHTHAQTDVTGLDAALSTKASLATGLVPTAQLGSGTPNNSVFLRGDQTWAAPAGGPSGGMPSTWVTLSTHVLTGSTTMQSVTGMAFAVSSAAIYRYEFLGGWQTTSSAAGIAFGINGPAGVTALSYKWEASTGMGGVLTRAHAALGAQQIAVPQSSAANVTQFGHLTGIVRTGINAGTLQWQYATEVAGSTVSVRAGCVGFLFGPL